jgi:hypothetical protein
MWSVVEARRAVVNTELIKSQGPLMKDALFLFHIEVSNSQRKKKKNDPTREIIGAHLLRAQP